VKAPVALSLAAAVLIVAGCSHPAARPAAATASSSAPTVNPSPTPKPTPTLPTMEQARDTYWRLVKAPNKAVDAYNKSLDQGVAWYTARTYLRHMATATRNETKALQATLWPAHVQPAMKKWIVALKSDQVLLDRAAKASTGSAFWPASDKADGKRSYDAETKVRVALGLPAK
jgi:hypothetical protein